MRHISRSLILKSCGMALMGLGIFACSATPPPRELQDARAAYALAATSPGATRAQADVAEAKKALARAEEAFVDSPGGDETRDWAYIASRKAGSARAKANALTALEEGKVAMAELRERRAQQQAMQGDELQRTRGQLASQSSALMSERQARSAAEDKTREALGKIAGMSAVQNERGLTLTLSGSVLFATGKSQLLASAQTRLQEAATAIQEDGRSVTIVGHTDSVGADEMNRELSLKRAEAVRTYLVTHGVAAERVKAEGAGKTQPVADNTTAEGRANNRRVEVILERAKP